MEKGKSIDSFVNKIMVAVMCQGIVLILIVAILNCQGDDNRDSGDDELSENVADLYN